MSVKMREKKDFYKYTIKDIEEAKNWNYEEFRKNSDDMDTELICRLAIESPYLCKPPNK